MDFARRHCIWFAFVGLLLTTIVLLWDWGSPFPYFVYVVGIASLLIPVGIGINQYGHNGSPEPSVNTASQLPAWIGWIVLTAFAIPLVALTLTIIAYREGWTGIIATLRPAVDLASAIFPAVDNIPARMSEEGFVDRLEVTQVAGAIGHLTAAFVATLIAAALAFVSSQSNEPDVKLPRAQLPTGWELVMFSACLVGVVAYTATASGVAREPIFREMFAHFETSDLSLCMRMWIYPCLFYYLLALVAGGAYGRFCLWLSNSLDGVSGSTGSEK